MPAYLTSVTRLAALPAAVVATLAVKGRVAAQQHEENDAETPHVTTLVVRPRLVLPHVHHLGRHVLGRADRRKQLGRRDGRRVTTVRVHRDATAQVEITDFHRNQLQTHIKQV